MKRPFQVATLATILTALFSSTANAQCELEEFSTATIFAPFGFGENVALSSERAVMSSFFNNELGYQVFERFGTDWFPTEILTPRVGTNFNLAMDMDKDTMVCGLGNDGTYGEVDPSAPSPSGECDVFDLETPGGFATQTLLPSDATTGQRFGRSVSISGNLMAIGSPGDSQVADTAGAVYLFELIDGTWVETGKIYKDSPQPFENFGSEVELDGRRLIVKGGFTSLIFQDVTLPTLPPNGGIFAPFPATSNVFVFENQQGQWTQTAELSPPDQRLHSFAQSMAVSGNTILIGAREGFDQFTIPPTFPPTTTPGFPTENAANYGMVLVYEKVAGSWTLTERLRAPGQPQADDFGASLAIRGRHAIVGSPIFWTGDATFHGEGGAITYRRTDAGWRKAATLDSSVEGLLNGAMGRSVALTEHMALVGAPSAMVNGISAGKAFAFGIGEDCSGNNRADTCDIANGFLSDTDGDMIPDGCESGDIVTFCDGTENTNGLVSSLDIAGETSISMNEFNLRVLNAAPEQVGFFIVGNGTTRLPFGEGTRCVGGHIGAQFSGASNDAGEVLRNLDVNTSMLGLAPYTSWNFQYAYRDGTQVHLTNAVHVTFMP